MLWQPVAEIEGYAGVCLLSEISVKEVFFIGVKKRIGYLREIHATDSALNYGGSRGAAVFRNNNILYFTKKERRLIK